MKTALVHEFLVTWGGSDLVASTFCELYPDAPLFTALFDPRVNRLGMATGLVLVVLLVLHGFESKVGAKARSGSSANL